jgi:hypothetical protein
MSARMARLLSVSLGMLIFEVPIIDRDGTVLRVVRSRLADI